ncbi:hypothetical protein JW964_23090 [candidate division KSB1 bacterium]|nr:hypothetical protein [candidate division KSB1 bacterium]
MKKSGYYRMMSKRFMYAICYEIHYIIAQIIAILLMRRDRAWIMKELEARNS